MNSSRRCATSPEVRNTCSPCLARRSPGGATSPATSGPKSLVLLTEREQEVLELLASGQTNAETTTTLGIALRTIEAHRAHIFQKLGFKSRAELVRFASEHQLA